MLHTCCRMQLHVPCNLSYATTQICNCMCRMQLNFSCMRQLQNPKFLVVTLFNKKIANSKSPTASLRQELKSLVLAITNPVLVELVP